MTNQFQPGDRVEFYQGEDIAFRADVLKVARNGRLWVERWFQHMNAGDPELIRQWQDASKATLIRRPKVRIELTPSEAQALLSAAEAGTCDDAMDNLGWPYEKKLAYRGAVKRLIDALRFAPT